MNDKTPSLRENELLKQAYHYIEKFDRFPGNTWLGQQLNLDSNGICNLKRRLREKGYIRKDQGMEIFTNEAYQYLANLQSHSKIVIPFEIRVLGKVQAGPKERDEIAVVMSNSIIDAPIITIPHLNTDSVVFALQVEGQSMEYEHIFDGDYVIVERFSNNEQPKQNEMIVTMYLPPILKNMMIGTMNGL